MLITDCFVILSELFAIGNFLLDLADKNPYILETSKVLTLIIVVI